MTGIDVWESPALDVTRAPSAGRQLDSLDSPAGLVLYLLVWLLAGDVRSRAKLATVRVARRGGRRILLRAPLVTSWQDDPEFEDKARLIRRWWRDYGQGPAG